MRVCNLVSVTKAFSYRKSRAGHAVKAWIDGGTAHHKFVVVLYKVHTHVLNNNTS